MQPSRTLILSDGGLPSLLACVVAREALAITTAPKSASPSAPAELPFPAALGPERISVIRRQADLLALGMIDVELPRWTGGSSGEQETHNLLSAAYIAATNKCDLVVWPESAALGDNLDLDRIAQITDRALLAGRLAAVDSREHGVASIRIEAPYADFTDKQIAELALDMAAPIEACWWWGAAGALTERERARWMAALQAVGWSPASV